MVIKGREVNIKQQRILIRKYLSGTANSTEISKVDNWYNSFNDSQVGVPVSEQIAAESKQFILTKTSQSKSVNRLKVFYKYAAALAAIALLVFLYSGPKRHFNENLVFIKANAKADTAIILLDGSKVWLKAKSKLSYDSKDYGIKSRTINLVKGEAYFEVTRNKQLPFSVIQNYTTIQVLGTGFSVFTDQETGKFEVRVSHGLVKIIHRNKPLFYLKKGEAIALNTNSGKFQTERFNSKYAAAWTNEQVSLKQVSFEELSDVFFNLYRKRLKSASDNSEKYTYTLDIHKNDTYQSTIAIIASIHQNKFTIQSDTILIY
jgi:ferric-dicitrate binding protein FerR (iron transport regulator)